MSCKHLTTLKSTYLKLRYLISAKAIFVGHGLKNDFKVLNLIVSFSGFCHIWILLACFDFGVISIPDCVKVVVFESIVAYQVIVFTSICTPFSWKSYNLVLKLSVLVISNLCWIWFISILLSYAAESYTPIIYTPPLYLYNFVIRLPYFFKPSLVSVSICSEPHTLIPLFPQWCERGDIQWWWNSVPLHYITSMAGFSQV